MKTIIFNPNSILTKYVVAALCLCRAAMSTKQNKYLFILYLDRTVKMEAGN